MVAPTPPAEANEVLQFWFGDGPPFMARPQWFQKNDRFDREIEQRFSALIERALRGELSTWGDGSADTALAQLIVLDQFTRNTFRGTPRAFAGDVRAEAAARAMLARHQDQQLAPLQRLFVYLPLEHAENLALQEESVRLFAVLEADAPETAAGGLLDYAQKHRDVIARFGRFPHRNAILGRTSTPEELAFLQQPGSSF